ncbi:MAG: flagellar basal body rod protein FlgC [Azospirillaceae bacterium]
MDLQTAMFISASGLRAQGTRLKVVAENLANAQSTGDTPEAPPYRRQVVSFRDVFDREMGGTMVEVGAVETDPSTFPRRYDPSHPAADDDGYVTLPNVNTLVEMMDMREAQRSYEANLRAVEAARSMLTRTIDLLRA